MHHHTSRLLIALLLVSALLLGHSLNADAGGPARQDTPGVTAEAVGQANLRAGPGIEYRPLGEIVSGTRYPVLARHTVFPWVQIEVPDVGAAWVYVDLVTVYGDLNAVPGTDAIPPLDAAQPSPTPITLPTPTGTAAGASPSPAGLPAQPTATSTPAQPTATPTALGPTATTLGEANIRFGPDVTYPVIVQALEGQTFRIVERHTLVPWIRVALDDSPTGTGWIFNEIVEISGDLYSVPATNANVFGYPTLTPTPQTVLVDIAPWPGAPVPSGQLATTLGEQMHAYLLEQGFSPYSDRVASVFVMDLETGDRFTLNDGVAFSGMSLTKIPILATYFQRNPQPLNGDDALLIANTMMCSENITTNRLLQRIGSDGTALSGAQAVTAFLQSLGLTNTFIMRQYLTLPDENPPHAGTITTGADQERTQPDLYNQITPHDLGWLLASLYQCAESETGLLVERYPDSFNAQTCRRALYAMDANEIGVFLEEGTPAGTRVIHKHGWIGDTHGDAGIVIGPDTAYVFVVTLYAEGWLEFDDSAPVIAELARMAWNALNPSQPLAVTQSSTVPGECDPANDPVVSTIQHPTLPMIGP